MIRWLFARRAAGDLVSDDAWERVTGEVAPIARLSDAARDSLRELTAALLDRKSLEGADGLALDDYERVLVAAQACLPVLGLDLSWYAPWHSIIVYRGDFVAPREYVDEVGVVHQGDAELAGEAWDHGPVVLSLDGVLATALDEEWGNLVVHECAHKLDLLNGDANGLPPLPDTIDRAAWTRDFTEAFEALIEGRANLGPEFLSEHATESPGEFFAIASEAFFAHPEELDQDLPRIYGHLSRFYRQEPLGRR